MNMQLNSNSEYQGAGNMNGNCVHWSRESTFPLLLLHLLVCVFMDFLGIFTKLKKQTVSFIMSVCPSSHLSTCSNSVPTDQIFMKFDIWVFFENLSRKLKSLKSDKHNRYSTWRPTYFYDNMLLHSSYHAKFLRQNL